MHPSRESVLEERACDRILDELGVRSIKLIMKADSGWPDRLFLIPGGKPFFIEFKMPGEVPDPLQAVRHAFMEYNKYEVETHTTVQGALDAVDAKLDAAIGRGWSHDPAHAKALLLEATSLPKAGGKVPNRKGRGRAAT